MSEYQYYEFRAIDCPLTAKEMGELRSYSTRARITPTSFVNDYSWGSFKGDADAWMEKYFDAFLYLANWGTRVLKLRLPSRLLAAATARAYCGGDSAFLREKPGETILSFVSEDEEGGDLLHVAAEASVPIGDTGLDRNEVHCWVGKLPAEEKDELITNLVVDADHAQSAELLQRFLKERQGDGGPPTSDRTVGQLLRAARAYATERGRLEAENLAKDKARREREAAIAREKHLDSLVGREAKLWTEVDGLVAMKQPKKYDQAVKILVDLRDLAARGKEGDFGLRIEALRQAQAKKPSFSGRLRKAGL